MLSKIHSVPSPNFNARVREPDMVVLHYTDMADVDEAIGWLTTTKSRVSAHYLITAEGEIVKMVDEADRAWHAGVSFWDGDTDINGRAIGIELDNPGHRPDAPEFPVQQMDRLVALLSDIRTRWTIPKRGIVAHSDIAPMRKIDPGERFPWKRLAQEDLALFIPIPEVESAPLDPAKLWPILARGGYMTPSTAEEEHALLRAFHRRHRPNAVEQEADNVTHALATEFADAVAADRRATPDPSN